MMKTLIARSCSSFSPRLAFPAAQKPADPAAAVVINAVENMHSRSTVDRPTSSARPCSATTSRS